MRISEYQDERALDLLAEIIEPATEIIADEEVKRAAEEGKKAHAVAVAIKNHKKAVLSVLAAIDGVPVNEYHCNVLTIPLKLLELFDDPNVAQLFTFAGQTVELTPSGSLTGNTKGKEQ